MNRRVVRPNVLHRNRFDAYPLTKAPRIAQFDVHQDRAPRINDYQEIDVRETGDKGPAANLQNHPRILTECHRRSGKSLIGRRGLQAILMSAVICRIAGQLK